jgi:two-component sensor histidine kinase/ligand-binding sensor domain-containing protein
LKKTLFIFSIFCSYFSICQDLRLEKIGIDQGISQNSCLSICKDSVGFYWVGTEDGLNRYSGTEVEVFKKRSKRNSISNNHILKLATISQRFILISTKGGLDIYDYTFDKIEKNIIPQEIITDAILIGKNQVLLSTENGAILELNYLNNKWSTLRRFKGSVSIKCLTIDQSGENLYAGLVKGAFQLDLQTNQKTDIAFDGYSIEDVSVYDIETMNGHIYFAGETYGVFYCRLNDSKAFKINVDAKTVVSLKRVGDLLWYGGEDVLGQLIESPSGKILHRNYDMEKGSYLITCIYGDDSKEIAVGTYGSGFYLFKETLFSGIHNKFKVGGLNSYSIWGFKSKNSLVLVNGDNGIDAIDGKKNIFDYKLNGFSLKGYDVQDYIETSHAFWVATFKKGLIKIDKRTTNIEFYDKTGDGLNKICSNKLRKIFIDSKNRLWIGSFGEGFSILNINDNEIVNYKSSNDPNFPNFLFSFYEDVIGNIFIGSYKGLIKYSNGTFKKLELSFNGNTIDFVFDINPINNSEVWLSTSYGVHRYHIFSEIIMNGYTFDDGLPDNHIYGSVIDKNGKIWVSSNNGLACIVEDKNEIHLFDETDGLQSREFNGTAFGKFDQMIYFGGINGINYFHPDSIQFSNERTEIYLARLSVNYEPYFIQDSSLSYQLNYISELKLNYKQNNLSFDFFVPSTKENFSYEYMLEGIDEDWIHSKKINAITYRNLPSGEYVLRIKAKDNKSQQYSKVKELRIIISSPFWRKLWFIILVIAIVVLVGIGLFLNRVRREQKMNAELTKRVDRRTKELKKALNDKEILFQEVHHRVKNNLQLISSLLNLQSHSVQDEKALEAFEKSKDRIRSMALVHTKLYQNQEKDSLDMSDYLNELYDDIMNSFQQGTSVDLDLKVDDVQLSVETSVKFGLIVTELIINAFKYGFNFNNNPCLKITLLKKGKGFELILSDNGGGFSDLEKLKSSESLGQEIIEALVEQLNGTIEQYNDNGAVNKIYFEDNVS